MIPVDTHHGDDINARAILLWGFVSVVVTILCIFSLHALYNWYADQQTVEKLYQAEYKAAANELHKQQGQLQQAVRWLDDQGNVVGVPIERAMELTLEEFRRPAQSD